MIQEVIQQRRSIRQYLSKPVEEEVLQIVLEAGRRAPTARNEQGLRLLVVQGQEKVQDIVERSCTQKQFGKAPVFLAVASCSTREMMCHEKAATVDATIALSFMMLQAEELGLGTCWLGSFDDVAVRDYFGLSEEWKVVCATPLGYANEEPAEKEKKPLEELLLLQ